MCFGQASILQPQSQSFSINPHSSILAFEIMHWHINVCVWCRCDGASWPPLASENPPGGRNTAG